MIGNDSLSVTKQGIEADKANNFDLYLRGYHLTDHIHKFVYFTLSSVKLNKVKNMVSQKIMF